MAQEDMSIPGMAVSMFLFSISSYFFLPVSTTVFDSTKYVIMNSVVISMKKIMDKEKDVKNFKLEIELISFYLMMPKHIHFHVIAL